MAYLKRFGLVLFLVKIMAARSHDHHRGVDRCAWRLCCSEIVVKTFGKFGVLGAYIMLNLSLIISV